MHERGSDTLPVHYNDWLDCGKYMMLRVSRYKERWDMSNVNDQKEWLNIMSNDALYAYKYGLKLWHVANQGPERRKELSEMSVSLSTGFLNAVRKGVCEEWKNDDYYKNEANETTTLEEYCVDLENRLVRLNPKTLQDSKEGKARNPKRDNKDAHNQCKNVADYEGCMRYQGIK